MIRDLGAESLALHCIRDRSIARGADEASSSRGHREPPLLQCEHCDLETLAFLAQQVFLRHARVLQTEVAGVAGANAHLAVNRARGKTFHRALDDEAGHPGVIALAPLLFISPAKEEKVVSRVGKTDPHLLAIQPVLVAFAARRRARADDIRTDARFRQTVGREFLAFGLWHEGLLVRLFIA